MFKMVGVWNAENQNKGFPRLSFYVSQIYNMTILEWGEATILTTWLRIAYSSPKASKPSMAANHGR